MEAFAKSDIGKARDMNQDFYSIPSDEQESKLFILADGMGGYQGGEIASRIATASVKSYITNNLSKALPDREEILK